MRVGNGGGLCFGLPCGIVGLVVLVQIFRLRGNGKVPPKGSQPRDYPKTKNKIEREAELIATVR